jgi:hypothetical protein
VALIASDYTWHLSGATSDNGAQTDPNASLGRFRSSTQLRAINSTLTANASAGALRVVDSAQIGAGSQVGRWILFMTGALGGVIGFHASRITGFDSGTGTFHLHDPLPAAGAIGDRYHVFQVASLFDQVTAAESALAAGHADHRMVVGFNGTGSSANDARFHLEEVDPGPVSLELVVDDATAATDYGLSALDTDDPDLSLYPEPRRFAAARSRDSIAGRQPVQTYNSLNNARTGIWLRRNVEARVFGKTTAVWRLVMTSSTAGVDPNPFASACLLVFGLAGVTRSLAFQIDRRPRILGGARLEATLTGLETGLPMPDELVTFGFTGPGSISASEDLTDSRGVARVAYTSPVSDSFAGQTLAATAEA